MKNKLEQHENDHDLEILKAVAHAWHGHSGSSTTANEFDARRLNFKSKPSRFKLEAMSKSTAKARENVHWNFAESLWDSYEIVSVSKKLESALVLNNQFSESDYRKRKKESSHSLRSLFNAKSSRRFKDEEIPSEEDD